MPTSLKQKLCKIRRSSNILGKVICEHPFLTPPQSFLFNLANWGKKGVQEGKKWAAKQSVFARFKKISMLPLVVLLLLVSWHLVLTICLSNFFSVDVPQKSGSTTKNNYNKDVRLMFRYRKEKRVGLFF